jgi:hypothetical protein
MQGLGYKELGAGADQGAAPYRKLWKPSSWAHGTMPSARDLVPTHGGDSLLDGEAHGLQERTLEHIRTFLDRGDEKLQRTVEL